MIDKTKIAKATELLRKAAKPKKIILFGSYARNEADEGNDIDFLVVEKTVKDCLPRYLLPFNPLAARLW